MKLEFYLMDVFTERRFGGNQLAVVPNADAIDADLMQAITREFNFSETVFLLRPRDPAHASRVRIFTPGTELPFAGHPTVGAALLLAHLNPDLPETTVLEEGVGDVRIAYSRHGAARHATLSTRPPEITRVDWIEEDTLARLISLERADLDARFPTVAASSGVPFTMIRVRDRAALGRAKLDLALWTEHVSQSIAPQVFVYTDDAELPASSIRARMFSPAFGIPEDPATGSAAAALAGVLATHDSADRWVIEQGFEMGRPSIMAASVQRGGGTVSSVSVGGGAVIFARGEMEV